MGLILLCTSHFTYTEADLLHIERNTEQKKTEREEEKKGGEKVVLFVKQSDYTGTVWEKNA